MRKIDRAEYPKNLDWEDKVFAMPNIPRGDDGLIAVLRELLTQVAKNTSPAKVIKFAGSDSNVSLGQLCVRLRPMKLVMKTENGWRLTEYAKKWLDSGDDRYLAAVLCANIKFLGEILYYLDTPKKSTELQKIANDQYGLSWKTLSDVNSRLLWLRAFGYVDFQEFSLLYSITDSGKEFLADIDITDIEMPTRKFYVNGIEVVQVGERVQYYGNDGKLITESLTDYTKRNLKEQFSSLDDFIKKWSEADKKSAIIEELAEQGILLDELREEVKQKTGKDLSVFDLICHVTFDMPPLSRKERAEKVKKRNYFGKYSEKARKVLNALIDKFADAGIEEIENREILYFQPFDEIGTPVEIIKEFGGKAKYEEAIKELEKELFKDNEVA